MPLEANLYAAFGTKPMSIADYDEQSQALQKNALSLNVAQQEADEKNALRSYVKSGADLSTPQGQQGLVAAAPTFGPGLLKSLQEAQAAKALTGKNTAEAGLAQSKTTASQLDQRITLHNFQLQQLASVSTPEEARQWAVDGFKAGAFTPEEFARGFQSIPTDPQQLAAWKDRAIQGGEAIKDQLDQQKQLQIARERNQTQIATNAATNATSRANNSATIAAENKRAGLNADGTDPSGGTGGLTPAAIENAATRYNIDGTLPPQLGRGTQGARDIRAIQNRAAELAMGTDPAQLRVNQLDAKSASSALNQLTKARTMAASFEDTANQNASLALSLSKQNDRTGIPLLNAGLQAWRTGTGSPEASQFAAANETFVNEYAKIMSGGMGNSAASDSARARASHLLSTAMTPQQYEANVRLLQNEMENRMRGFDAQEKALKGRITHSQSGGGIPVDQAAIAAELKRRGVQ